MLKSTRKSCSPFSLSAPVPPIAFRRLTTDAVNISRPMNTQEVTNWSGVFPPVSPAGKPGKKVKAACDATGVDYDAVGQTIVARKAELINQLIVFSVAHELGHATGARHHAVDSYALFTQTHSSDSPEAQAEQARCYSSGDHNCLMRYWNYDDDWSELVLFYSGKWNLLTPSTGGRWAFCDQDLPNMHIKK